MPPRNYDADVQRRLDTALGGSISDEAVRAFLVDLRDAVGIQSKLTTIERAPYVDPFVAGGIRSEIKFPGYRERYNGPSFSFMVRPLEGTAASTKDWYGVPMWLNGVVSYEESRLGERKISAFRLGKEINSEDNLLRILREKQGRDFPRANQDIIVNMTIADLLAAYQTENGTAFSGLQVQRAKAVIPTNPAYTTEAVGFVVNKSYLPRDQVCFGYGIGETFYRGRPILGTPQQGPRLIDINERGEEAFFNVGAVSQLQGQDQVGDVKVGNFVVIALPLVGPAPMPPTDYESRNGDAFSLGGNMRGGGSLGIDLATLNIGRKTGNKSRLVSGQFDSSRPVSILDVQLLALTPAQIPDALVGLPE